jgi:hypothetical protein
MPGRPPASVHARALCTKIRERLPQTPVVITMLGQVDAQLARHFSRWQQVTIAQSIEEGLVAPGAPAPVEETPSPTPVPVVAPARSPVPA